MISEKLIDYGLASTASHPLTVKLIDHGPGIWGNVATGLITAGAAIAAVMLTHSFTMKREKRASEEKLNRERYFIATELVFLLERFAQHCVSPATGSVDIDDKGNLNFPYALPEFDYTTVSGDRRSLPSELLYSLSEFPVLLEEARRSIEAAKDNDDPLDISSTVSAIRSEASSLGVRALRLSRQLRELCDMPRDDLSRYPWSAWNVLSKVHEDCINEFVSVARGHLHAAASANPLPELSSGEKL